MLKYLIIIIAVVIVAGHFIPISTKYINKFDCVSQTTTRDYRVLFHWSAIKDFKEIKSQAIQPATDCATGLKQDINPQKLYLW